MMKEAKLHEEKLRNVCEHENEISVNVILIAEQSTASGILSIHTSVDCFVLLSAYILELFFLLNAHTHMCLSYTNA